MDFGSVLQAAKKNDRNKAEVRSYSTKFSAPKKAEKKAKSLSVNIQKFLARKEAEEKRKTNEANQKREDLLALRSKDKKATRRVNVMLKRTKSANQSVIEDAIDKDNTAVTLAGPSQPDEDDYGYVSQEAAAFYNKMMEKYNKLPDDPKFPQSRRKASSNLSSTKDRVKAALEKEKEDALLPHRRKRKHKEEGEEDKKEDSGEDEEEEQEQRIKEEERAKEESAKKKLKPPPPSLNFEELLKLAAQKQHEPIMIDVKPKDDDGPPLTKKQKKEQERYQQYKEAKKRSDRPEQVENRISKLSSVTAKDMSKVPIKSNQSRNPLQIEHSPSSSKLADKSQIKSNGMLLKKSAEDLYKSKEVKPLQNKSSREHVNFPKAGDGSVRKDKVETKVFNNKSNLNDRMEKRPSDKMRVMDSKSKSLSDVWDRQKERPSSSSSKQSTTEKQSKQILENRAQTSNSDVRPRQYLPGDTRAKQYLPGDIRAKQYLPGDIRAKQYLPGDVRAKQAPSSDNKFNQISSSNVKSKPQSSSDVRPKPFPPSNVRPKPFPPSDVRPKTFPPSDVRPKTFPPSDVRPKPFPPSDIRPKPFPPSDVRPKQVPPKDVKPKQFTPSDARPLQKKPKPQINSKRRIYDDEDEYDSEMDDFIDDGTEEGEDYSKYIKDIFGYDKSKYRGVDDDDIEETSFAQQMREDIRSTKIGIMEDLEDIKREKQEKRQKALMKKRFK